MTTEVIVLKGDLDLHEAAADQLLRLIDGKDNYSLDDMSPIETVIVRRMLSAVKGGRLTLPSKKTEKLPEDLASGYVLSDLATPSTGLIQPNKPANEQIATLGKEVTDKSHTSAHNKRPDLRFMDQFHKSSYGLYSDVTLSRTPRMPGYGDRKYAALVALLADGVPCQRAANEVGLTTATSSQMSAHAELMSRLPKGEARNRWLQLRYNLGAPGDIKPTDEVKRKVDEVTLALLACDQSKACRLLGVTA